MQQNITLADILQRLEHDQQYADEAENIAWTAGATDWLGWAWNRTAHYRTLRANPAQRLTSITKDDTE